MIDDRPSTTALVSAFGRAHHAAHDRPPIFDDSLARAWFTDEDFALYTERFTRAIAFFDPEHAAIDPESALARVLQQQSTPITTSRARYTEDVLAHAQYVILGAGLDTFAFRNRERAVEVFELDHPATQRWKRARIDQLGWAVPERLHLLPIDFAHDELAAVLARSSFAPATPTLFSWLGVTYYLTEGAVRTTLRSLAGLAAPGSVLVFDYLDADAFIADRAAPSMQKMHEAVRRAGEPMQTGFPPSAVRALLAETGWQLDDNLGPAELDARYFTGRAYRPMPHFWIARASRR